MQSSVWGANTKRRNRAREKALTLYRSVPTCLRLSLFFFSSVFRHKYAAVIPSPCSPPRRRNSSTMSPRVLSSREANSSVDIADLHLIPSFFFPHYRRESAIN